MTLTPKSMSLNLRFHAWNRKSFTASKTRKKMRSQYRFAFLYFCPKPSSVRLSLVRLFFIRQVVQAKTETIFHFDP